ncbi:hypothetical protein JXA85_06430 [Candidatus Woesearchaeota archaeon]|nr:hypothetical protein [Candidatus Woesearchaeota archaeon]
MKKISLLFIGLMLINFCYAQKIAVSPAMIEFSSSEQSFTIINPNDYDIHYRIESVDSDWFSFSEDEGLLLPGEMRTVLVSLRNQEEIPLSTTYVNIAVRTYEKEDNGLVLSPGIILKAKILRGRKGFEVVVAEETNKVSGSVVSGQELIMKKVSPSRNNVLLAIFVVLVLIAAVVFFMVRYLRVKDDN